MTIRSIATASMLLIFVGACGWLTVRAPAGVSMSADPGVVGVPVWFSLIPVVLALAVIRVTPPKLWDHPVRAGDRAHLHRELILLLVCAVAFPLLIAFWVGFVDEGYVLTKIIVLLAIPGIALTLWRRRQEAGTVTLQKSSVGLWPLLPVAIYILLTQLGPLAPPPPTELPDPVTLIVLASVTALTAGVGEEIFYRYWLQTRLEALGGRWFGILSASLLFAGMHLGSHGQTLAWDLRLVSVIAQQGTFGIVCGYLWSRYRRLWAPITTHVLFNGLGVVLYLVGL